MIDVQGTHREREGAMEEPRKLYRSRNHRMVAGVCYGLAEYFNIDATLIRALFLLLARAWRIRTADLHRDVDHRPGREQGVATRSSLLAKITG